MGCSEFAGRAMIPAMAEIPEIEIKGIASRNLEKAEIFASRFNTNAYEGYEKLLSNNNIDAIYMPLPVGLHGEWITRTLEAGKHILVEKSFAPDLLTAEQLTEFARSKNLLIIENFLFPHHSQSKWITDKLNEGVLGEVKLFRSNFSIPKLSPGNIRYNSSLGGGALLDLGAYLVKFARYFLGNKLEMIGATLEYDSDTEVDMAGTAAFTNRRGKVAQVAFNLDSYYQNNWEFIGSKGKMVTQRAYTPPPGFAPTVRIEQQNHREEFILKADNHYVNKLRFFVREILKQNDFTPHWSELTQQAYYIDMIKKGAYRS